MPLARRLLPHGNSIGACAELWFGHWPFHRLNRGLHDEQEHNRPLTGSLTHPYETIKFRLNFSNFHFDLCILVKPGDNVDKLIGQTKPPKHRKQRLERDGVERLDEIDEQRPGLQLCSLRFCNQILAANNPSIVPRSCRKPACSSMPSSSITSCILRTNSDENILADPLGAVLG